MPLVLPPPTPIACTAPPGYAQSLGLRHAAGPEGRVVSGNTKSVVDAWRDRSAYLARLGETPSLELPPVAQFPVAQRVTTTFREAGQWRPLPFPNSDD